MMHKGHIPCSGGGSMAAGQSASQRPVGGWWRLVAPGRDPEAVRVLSRLLWVRCGLQSCNMQGGAARGKPFALNAATPSKQIGPAGVPESTKTPRADPPRPVWSAFLGWFRGVVPRPESCA